MDQEGPGRSAALDEWVADGLDGEQLFALALSRPALVLSWCDADMAGVSSAVGESYAWQARGLATRENRATYAEPWRTSAGRSPLPTVMAAPGVRPIRERHSRRR